MLKADPTGTEHVVDPAVNDAQETFPGWFWGAWGLFTLAGVWSYWPIVTRLAATWSNEPDYSHGFLVVPVALGLMWLRLDQRPPWALSRGSLWCGVGVILASQFLRLGGEIWYYETLEEWSLIVWVAGCVLLFGGASVLWWGMPAILFLLFMVPLPWRYESALSFPLQTVATNVSVWLLQFLGQPALAMGHVIRLGENTLEVAQACSGLRMVMSIAAIGAAFIILFRRSIGHRLLLLLALVPIAIVANSMRIVVTALLYRWVSSEAGQAFSHDFAGWVMIPVAAAMFLGWNYYLDHLFLEATEVRPRVSRDSSSARETSVARA